MLTEKFWSQRLKKTIAVIMTYDKITYVSEDNEIITINRPDGFHHTEDGIDRAYSLFDDYRFDYWRGIGEI